MTACVNDNQKKGGYGKAVSATLAGVLAVGMVPATALAADGDATVTSEGGIDLLAIGVNAFTDAKLTSATDNSGNAATINKSGVVKLTTNGTPVYLTSVVLTVDNGTAEGQQITAAASDTKNYSFVYKNSSSVVVQPNQINSAGSYTLEVTCLAKGEYEGQTKTINIEVENPQTQNTLTIGQVETIDSDSSEIDVVSSDIVFNGTEANEILSKNGTAAAGNLVVLVNGEPLASNAASSPSIVGIYPAGKTSSANKLDDDSVLYAGDYTAQITYGTESYSVDFTVAQFDLENAKITCPAVTTAPNLNSTANAGTVVVSGGTGALVSMPSFTGDLSDYFTVTYNATNNDGVFLSGISANGIGSYTFTLDVDDSNVSSSADKAALNASFNAPSADFDVEYVTNAVDIKYKDKTLAGAIGPFTIGSTAFATTDVNFTYTKDGALGTALPADVETDVAVYNENGDEVTDWATTPGKYTVVASVDAADCDFEFGGKATATFVVSNPNVSSDGIYVTYNGQVLSSAKIETTYNGENVIDDIAVTVKSGKKTLVEGTDYELVYTNTDTNKEVDEIINAGNYQLTVKPISFSSFTGGNNEVAIAVAQITPTALRVAGQEKIGSEEGLPYTGSEITPAIEYTTAKDPTASNAKWVTLPADIYALSYSYTADTANAKAETTDTVEGTGTYAVTLTQNATDASKNYALAGLSVPSFKVLDRGWFVDVPADEWYAEYIQDAVSAGYMFGIGNSDIFGPDMPILRSDIAVVLYRMAGGTTATTRPLYAAPFADVTDTDAYYFNSVGFCKNTGIITGFSNTGLFEPSQNTTREQFAVMMMRYAKAVGNYKAPEESTAALLANFKDGDKVSDWARDAVAWAYANELISGYGDTGVFAPQNVITRAQVAKITTIYQPEALHIVDNGSDSDSSTEAAVKYTIAKNLTGDNYDVTFSPETAAAGQKVTMTITADEGSDIDSVKSVTVTATNGQSVTATQGATDTEWTFTMPASGVTVNVNVETK